jgi:hypothetical protein
LKVKDNIGVLIPSPSTGINRPNKQLVGKVFGVVMNENTPTPTMFQKVGGWGALGSVFYLDYEQTKDTDDVDLDKCKIARPLFPNQKYYPLVGELVFLIDLPGAGTQLLNSTSEKYYISSINIWNNIHHNAQPSSNNNVLGKTFIERQDVSPLQPYEGDYILEGRYGGSVRFGSTVKDPNHPNMWSKVGKEGDPILIITNKHAVDPKSTTPYIEDINNDGSSIYLTSSQSIPLKTDKIAINPITKPIEVSKYIDPQLVLTGNRVLILSKKDDVFVVGKTNIEVHAKVINLNSTERTHIHSPKIFLGTKKNGDLADEPLLLGDKTIDWLNKLCQDLSKFCSALETAVSTPQGTPIQQVNTAAQQLNMTLEDLIQKTETLKSKQNYGC